MRIEESQGSTGQQNGHAPLAKPPATAEQILGEIRDYCRQTQTAESTFGRLVVNDGKLVSRLRDGARITTGTLDKVRTYLSEHRTLPAALSEGIGSQVQKPLAIVVVTGMMLAPIVILVTLPVLISVFSRRAR